MKNIIRRVIIILCFISIIKTLFIIFNYDDKYKEENKSLNGIITNIKKTKNNTQIDIKNKKKYKITIYDNKKYEIGNKVEVTGTFKTATNNTVFNLFNYKKYLLSKKIELISTNPKIITIKRKTNIFYTLKNNIIKHIDKYKSSAYLKLFILADSSMLDDTIKESYRNIGISHLFAISGMHVGIFMFIINKLLKRFKYKELISFLFFLFLLFITNNPESLQRCFVFYIFNIINKKINFEFKIYQIVIISGLLLLLFNSFLIYNVGFVFSVTITFFITLLNEKLLFDNYFMRLVKISLISFLASLPIIAFNFFKINFISILINIIFVPLVTFIIFPFGLITFFFPFLDNCYYFLINVFEVLVKFIDKIKIMTFVISKPNIIFILLYYLFLFMFIKINKKYILLYFVLLIININSKLFIYDTTITFLDVKQGDSNVIIFPKGKTILMDTGGNYFSNNSISKSKIIPYINSKGISKINYLIITHGDYDHMGEAVNLVENFKVEKVIFNCGKFNELERNLIKVLDKKKIPYYSCIKELNIDNNKLYFLQTKEYDNENDNSSVIYTELNNHKFLFMGDAGVEVEKDLIEKYNLNDIDVLKVGHHGSKTSSSKIFIGEINPKYSVISVGKNNRYGHPNKEVLNNLEAFKTYRTDQDGSIMFRINKDKLKIETCVP